jgi:two-component sensor histidine kinase
VIEELDDGIGLPPGFDPRQDGKMGLQNVFLLGEDQFQARVSFRAERGVVCQLDFKDNVF